MYTNHVDTERFTKRSIAAMAALGIGDAAGDLGRDDEVRLQYGMLVSLLPEGKSTDDTEFTVLSARCLLDTDGEMTAGTVAQTWRDLVLSDGGAKKRGGMPLYGALWNLSQGIEPPLSGMDNAFNNDDGAAMRAVPFGIVAYGDPAEAARLAAIDASVSHDRDGIWSAQAIAASTAVALVGGSVEEVYQAGLDQIPQDSWLGRRMKLVEEILTSEIPEMEKFEALHTRLWTPKHSTAPEAIPQVYGLYRLCGGDFTKGFLLSANFGRDADTICALTLALCAAGSDDAIPARWIEQVRKPSGVCLSFAAEEDMVDLGTRLAELAIRRAGKK